MTPKRIRVIQLARRALDLDDETYRGVLFHHGGGVLSSKDLDERGFEGVMAYFTACGFRSTWTKRTYGNRPGRASPAQVHLVKALWREWTGADDEAALNRWIERSFGVSALRFATALVAAKAITGLRAMVARKPERAA